MKESWLEEPNCEFTVWLGNSVTSSTVPVTPLGKGKGWDKELFYLKNIYIYKYIYCYIGKPLLQSHSYCGKVWQFFLCSCLENPRDGGAWWAAVSAVAQSRT